MSTAKSRADKATELAQDVSVSEWDELLRSLADKWETAFMYRQRQARREGSNTPPPPPPGTDLGLGPAPLALARGSDLVTLENLIDRYLTDRDSPFHNRRPSTKGNYDSLAKRLKTSCGSAVLANWQADEIQRLYEGWTAVGVHIGNSMMAVLRVVLAYGASLKNSDCERLTGALRRFKFKTPSKSKKERLTFDQAVALRHKAREEGHASIARAQAFQWDCGFRQKDVLGEWVKEFDKGDSYVIADGQKWITGIRWEEIGNDFVLTHVTSKHQQLVRIPLKDAEMVMEELERDYPGCTEDRSLLPAKGPIIVSEESNLPWYAVNFRRRWRKLANELGVSKFVTNFSSRDGGADDDEDDTDDKNWGADADASAPRH